MKRKCLILAAAFWMAVLLFTGSVKARADGNSTASYPIEDMYEYRSEGASEGESTLPWVVSLEASPVTLVQDASGYTAEDNYFYYVVDLNRAALTAHLSDGTTVSGPAWQISMATGQEVSYTDSQEKSNAWGAGVHTGTITAGDVSTTITVNVIRVTGFEAEDTVYEEETHGWWMIDPDYTDYIYYEYRVMPGKVSVSFSDGATFYGTPDELSEAYGISVQGIGNPQSLYDDWRVGDTNSCQAVLAGWTSWFNIAITSSSVRSVSASVTTVSEHTDGIWMWYDDSFAIIDDPDEDIEDYAAYFHYNTPDIVFTINYNNGSRRTVDLWTLNAEGVEAYIYMPQDYDNPLQVGSYRFTAFLFGKEVTWTLVIEENYLEKLEKMHWAGGWYQGGNDWYYGDSTGVYKDEWVLSAGKWYLMGEDGKMLKGWQKKDDVWYYLGTNGAMTTGWKQIDGTWYFFKATGAMATGWVNVNGSWFYLDGSGAMKTGWQKVNGNWYLLSAGGVMQTGWAQDSGKWYYLGSDGAMKTGWQSIGGKWYYLNTEMKTGWQKVSGIWYFMGTDGAMTTGWKMIDGTWYYFKSTGAMAFSETLTIDGKNYSFGSNGAWIH